MMWASILWKEKTVLTYSTVSFVRCSGELFPADCFFHFTITQRTPQLQLSIYSEYQLFLYETIIEQREKGKTFNQIAELLNRKGYLSVRGKKFRGAHVHSIVKKKRQKDEKLKREYPEKWSDFSLEVVDKTLVNMFDNFLVWKSNKYMIWEIEYLIIEPNRKWIW